jgi:NADH dehydrogenase|tara:strand:- start:172 stop:525 length:354 start_codon:yes stop_codon:yes gene_type:complete
MSLNIIFTWWNRQTLGTFFKTLFYGKFMGRDNFGNKYYKSKNNERWVIYSNSVEATKITSDWYLWIHHTIDKIPEAQNKAKYLWQKKHLENQTGSKNSYKPVKIKRNDVKKKYETWK